VILNVFFFIVREAIDMKKKSVNELYGVDDDKKD
jgi:hypothetical protein